MALAATIPVEICGARPLRQPIQFNHAKHTQGLELACTMCHEGVEDRLRAALPGVEVCLGCHEEAVTDSPEEAKIRDYAAHGEEIPWRRLYRVPSHVFFSHRRHVSVAHLGCEACHGAMATVERPPPRPLKRIAMQACLACHRSRGASTDCISCHR